MRRLLAGALCLVICLGLFGANALAAVVLSVGSRGENVTKVQKRLIQYDYLDGTADGIYGEETAAMGSAWMAKAARRPPPPWGLR